MTKQLERYTECEDTIELELSEEQMLPLSRADAAIRSNLLPVPSTEKSFSDAPKDERDAWPAVILRISVVSVLSGGIAYLATTPAQPVYVGANAVIRPVTAETATALSADKAPVRFTNPFDATEVFEFPSGTSETEARQAVADLLVQRAHDRQNSSSKTTRQRGKTPGQNAPLTTASLAQRS
jgi:hypothetical protein